MTTRREFLKIGGLGALALLTGCGPRLQNAEPTAAQTDHKKTIQITGEIVPIPEGEGPPGILTFFTDPVVKFGTQQIEHNSDLIEQSALYVTRPDGTALKQFPTSLISSPVYSPDGSHLAVHGYGRGSQGEFGQLLVLTSDASEMVTRQGTPLSPAQFAWAPDNTSIFFTSRFYLARTLGGEQPESDLEQMQDPDSFPNWINGVYRYVFSEGRFEKTYSGYSGELSHNPSVSPDGSMVAFTRHTNAVNYEVMTANAQLPGTPRVIDSGTSLLPNPDTRIQWSPDGKRLYYMMDHGVMGSDGLTTPDNGNMLHIVNTESGETLKQPLPDRSYISVKSPTTAHDYYFRDSLDVSPDGTTIAFGSKGTITLMNSDGLVVNEYMLPTSITASPDDVHILPKNQIGFSADNQYFVLDPQEARIQKVNLTGGNISDTDLRFVLSSG